MTSNNALYNGEKSAIVFRSESGTLSYLTPSVNVIKSGFDATWQTKQISTIKHEKHIVRNEYSFRNLKEILEKSF